MLITTDLMKVSIKVFENTKKNTEPVKVTSPTFYMALIMQFPQDILVLIILSYHTLTNTAKLLNKHRLQFTWAHFPGSGNGYLHRPSPSGHHSFTFTQSNVLTCARPSSNLFTSHRDSPIRVGHTEKDTLVQTFQNKISSSFRMHHIGCDLIEMFWRVQ